MWEILPQTTKLGHDKHNTHSSLMMRAEELDRWGTDHLDFLPGRSYRIYNYQLTEKPHQFTSHSKSWKTSLFFGITSLLRLFSRFLEKTIAVMSGHAISRRSTRWLEGNSAQISISECDRLNFVSLMRQVFYDIFSMMNNNSAGMEIYHQRSPKFKSTIVTWYSRLV